MSKRNQKSRYIDGENKDKLTQDLFDAILVEDTAKIDDLARKGVDITRSRIESSLYSFERYTPITYAIAYKRKAALDYLLSLGADINYVPQDNLSIFGEYLPPIHVAMKSVDIEMASYLIEKGADINQLNRGKQTVLLAFIRMLNDEAVNFLIDNGVDLNCVDVYGNTVMHHANIHSLRLCKLLIQKGCDLDAKGEKGNTPLHNAIFSDCGDIAKALIKAGANVYIKNEKGETVIGFACERGRLNLLKHIQWKYKKFKPDSEGNTPFHLAAKANEPIIVKYLLDHPSLCDINAQNQKGETAMMLMSFNKDKVEFFKKALSNGLDLSIKNNKGETIADIAKRKKATLVQALLEQVQLESMIAQDNEYQGFSF